MQRLAGLAEGIKTAAILDRELWGWIEERVHDLSGGDIEALTELVRRTVSHKMEVVAEDPTETGRRAMLNFGHTVGHALEALEGYTVLHGEAVAAGMRVEARLGEILGITEPGTAERIVRLLDACGLDREWEAERRHDEVAEAMVLDKKSRAARPRCVFLERLGEVAHDATGGYTFALEEDTLEGPLADALRPASKP
jgi:3-dehydroquinate synthase